ncbi:MAG: hypothetical protein RIG82_12740 [Phycisphaeraceae bacterium]
MDSYPGPVSALRLRLPAFVSLAFDRARGPIPVWEAYAAAMHRLASLTPSQQGMEQIRAEAWARCRGGELNDELRRPQRVAVRVPVDLADWYCQQVHIDAETDLALIVPFLTPGVIAAQADGQRTKADLLTSVTALHRWLDDQGFARCVARLYADEGITEDALDLTVAAPIEPEIDRLW